ncbi:hypothetical protein IPM65_04360 [Candidatus Roizmanbacteria bacterium]|nr:MAG: hypothetical protein IPM65_04360 [Candidatus Roizmanbacteria bacterium]
MTILIILAVLFLISFILAWISMKDFHIPKEIRKMISMRKMKGSIVFFKNKVEHYSSSSSSSSN